MNSLNPTRPLWRCLALAGALFVLGMPLGAQYEGMSKKEVKTLIQQTRRMAADFERDFDHALDKSIIDNTKAENRYNNRAEKVEDHLDRAESTVGNREKTRKHLELAMESGFEIQKLLAEHRFDPRLKDEWHRVRGNLNRLARITGLDPLPIE